MASPYLTQDFHIRWSTLAPAHIQEDIRQAIQKAEAPSSTSPDRTAAR